LSDITPLQNLKKLKKLYLDGNNISDVSPLGGLINLSEKLLLYGNNISDVSPLTGLVNLKEAEFHENNISLEQRTALEKALPNTELYW
jgi:internalin A